VEPIFIQTIKNNFGDEGEAWLSALPDLIDEASRRWELADIQPLPNLSYHFVALALSGASDSEGTPALAGGARGRWAIQATRPSIAPRKARGSAQELVILKLGVPNRELTSEIAALRIYNGQGACRLLDADAEKGMLLLERLQPGHMLATLEDDERATRIAAEVMIQLWKSSNDFSRYIATAPAKASGAREVATTDFIYLKDWFDGFKRLHQRYGGGTGPLPEKLVETAEILSRELLTENKDEVLLHGDFHHFNVLESERSWLAIDPKGVVGPKGYEVGPLLINPVPDFLNGSNPRAQTEKRIDILSEVLDMERERIHSWAICHAVLSAWWSLEDNNQGRGEYSLRCAELFTTLLANNLPV
jgi:streptomycin 6-kinase